MSLGKQSQNGNSALLSANQLTKRYVLGLALIAALTLLSQGVIQFLVADQQYDSRVVNIAGLQRMLSQKISKLSCNLSSNYPDRPSTEAQARYRDELAAAVSLWERSHTGLIRGDSEMGLPGNNSKEVLALFAGIQAHHQGMVAAAKALLSSPPSVAALAQSNADIAAHEAAFLQGMNDIVFRYDLEAKAKVDLAKWLEIGLLGVTLLVLALEARFIFAPAARRIQRDTQRLIDQESQQRTTLDSAIDGILSLDAKGCLIDFNPAAETIFGWTKEEVVGRSMIDLLVPARHRQKHQNALASFVQARRSDIMNRRIEITALRRDGSEFPVELTVTPIRRNGEDIFIGYIRDITEQRLAQQRLRIAATAFESDQGMMVTDTKQVILSTNRAFTEITGYSAQEVRGQTPRLLSSGRHNAGFYAAMWNAIERTGSWQGEIWNRRKSGEVYAEWLTLSEVRDDAGHPTHYVGIFGDMTQRKQAEEEINTLAFYDPLTHLPNRRLLLDRLKQAMVYSDRSARHGALLFLDLDNFKNLNDTLGHDIGDLLLQQVALRLSACVREGDTVARLGGDEFVLMLEDLSELAPEAAAQAEVVAGKVLSALNEPYQLADHAYRGTPSIGVTLFTCNQGATDELLKRADLAMYQAKAAGRNAVRFFDAEMQTAVNNRVALETDLREGILQGQFLLYYQAQVDAQTNVTGVEVLLRWQHPRRGLVLPYEFIPLAEETGLIVPLGLWVLETACAQIKQWETEPWMNQLVVAVNISFKQLHRNDFVNQVLAVLDKTRANPQRLKLELTESLLVRDVEGVIAKMTALRAKGVSFSLDDFGTGYSSLCNLKRLPFDQVKIDRTFVRNIMSDPDDAAIAKMVVSLAASMGLEAIAEGVEVRAQRDYLASQGCRAFQGYLYSRPIPLREFERLVTHDQPISETQDLTGAPDSPTSTSHVVKPSILVD